MERIVEQEVVFFIVDGGSAWCFFEVVVPRICFVTFCLDTKSVPKKSRNPIVWIAFRCQRHIAVGNMIGEQQAGLLPEAGT